MWYLGIENRTKEFIAKISSPDFSSVSYTLTGDLDKHKSGLASYVFLVKILSMIGEIKNINQIQKNNLINNIVTYKKNRGLIFDQDLTGHSLLEEFISGSLGFKSSAYQKKLETRIAETRQSWVALMALGYNDFKSPSCFKYSSDWIIDYLESFDWTNPWHSASHVSHLIFFIINQHELDDTKKNVLLSRVLQWVDSIQDPISGSWFRGTVDLKNQINGAMKILTAFEPIKRFDFPFAKQLIDTALRASQDEEACSNFNVVYVLYFCSKSISNYRSSEINEFMLKRLDLFSKFYYPSIGGFSFYQDRSNDVLYGKRIANSNAEPDIHGTVMFLWGISLINKINKLDLNLSTAPN